MLIGNQESQQLLKSYLDIFLAGEKSAPSFYILTGPEHIGKSSFTQELIKSYLGDFWQTDFLHIRDMSAELGKHHSLKVEYDKSAETAKTMADEFHYKDLGVREINQRLQQSFVGKAKVVLIENIDRMAPAAANAFLKTCEEPLPHRIIIATTAHSSHLLDTIISRALVVHFSALSATELMQFAETQHMFMEDQELRELVCAMAMGKPGMLIHFHDLLSNDEDLLVQFRQLISLLTKGNSLSQSFAILKSFKDHGILESFVDGWIAYASDHGLPTAQWLKVKKLMQGNVHIENILVYGLLD